MTELSTNFVCTGAIFSVICPPMALFFDRATISGNARITPEGYFVADALVARANNIQEYRASELGLTDRRPDDVVRVFRPETEVFAADSIATAVRLPVTLDHPVKDGKPVLVDATNWREFTRGETGDEVLRDGEFMRVPLRVTDAAAVSSVRRDRQEFSLGYNAELRMEPGQFGDQAYDAVMSNIRYNHLAACRTARGGPELRIVDEQTTPPATGAPKMSKILMVDNLPVDVSDATAAEATISKLIGDRAAAQADALDAKGKLATAETTIAARDAEIVGLKDQVKNSQLSPAALRDAAANYARGVANAKALGATVTDAMDLPAVIAAAVAHKMGDAAKGYTPEQNAAAFDALVAGLGNQAAPVGDALRDTIIATPVSANDATVAASDARAKRLERYAGAHRGK